MEFGDLTTLITVGIAVFIFMRLRSVLGKRTGHQNPPVEPYQKKPDDLNSASNDNVVTLPKRGKSVNGENNAPEIYSAIDLMAKPGTDLNGELRKMKDVDAAFEPDKFLEGSKMAYEMIVTAFADGDKKTLKNLLSREVYEGFANAIKQREKDGLSVQSSFVGVKEAKIDSAQVTKKDANLTVRFVSQIISATYDNEGELVEGNSEQIVDVIDLWTFSRDVRSRDPNWKLVATESEA
ncbi:MAG: Tim44/TimA family putative adaptor protein [Rhizobiaceae bacterium]|nr:Tim44/TimA family putative adaptor protein [Rhizobiaceae bacterium]